MTVEQIIRFTRPFFPKWRDDLEQRYLKTFQLLARLQDSGKLLGNGARKSSMLAALAISVQLSLDP